MGDRRKRTAHSTTLEERLLKAAEDLRAKAGKLPPGEECNSLLKKAAQFETQASMGQLFVPPRVIGRNSLES
jgi:hypothetical protein